MLIIMKLNIGMEFVKRIKIKNTSRSIIHFTKLVMMLDMLIKNNNVELYFKID